MTPRREIGFLRSLLGQEEETDEQVEEAQFSEERPVEETAHPARSGASSPSRPQPAPPAPPVVYSPAAQSPSPSTPRPTLTQPDGDDALSILDRDPELPGYGLSDPDHTESPAPAVIHTEPQVPDLQAPAAASTPQQPATQPVTPSPAPAVQATTGADLASAVAQLKSPASDRRREALRALSGFELDREARFAVAAALQDPEHDIRSLALRVLERDPLEAPFDAVGSAALDADAGIRARALALLGRSSNATVLASLVGRIAAEEDEAVIGAGLGGAARLLSAIEASRLAQHTADSMAKAISGLPATVRGRFRREIGLIATEIPEDWIVAGLGAADQNVRRGMAILASERGTDASTAALSRLAGDADPEVRELALEAPATAEAEAPAVASVPDQADRNGFDNEIESVTIPVLMTALRDPQPAVRERAETALKAIRSDRVAGWLIPQIKAAQPEEAAHLADVALRLNLAEAVPPLVDHVLESSPGPEREQLAAALRNFSGLGELVAQWQQHPEGERRIAAVRLASLVNPNDPTAVAAGLKDPSATVRLAAIEAAEQMSAAEITESLVHTLATDSSSGVRLAAARAFLGSGRENRVKAAEIALRDSDREVRRTGVDLLSGVSEGETSILVRALQDPDDEVAGRAAAMLSGSPGPEALATLWSALRTSNAQVRETIIDALLGFGPEVLGRLARQAYESSDAGERALGLAMLIRLGNGGAHDLLIDSLSDPATDVRAEALGAMVQAPETMDIEAVGARVRDPHAQVRALAVSALAALDDDRALPYLLDASHDPVEGVRTSARSAILARSSQSVARMLIGALSTPNLRRTAVELLTQMGPVAGDSLVEALGSADDDLKKVIGETLAASGAAESLIDELGDRSAERRQRAIDALGAMKATSAVDALIARLEDPDGTVRAKAAEVLGDLGDVRATEPLKRIFVSDPDMDVVAATERSLRKLTGPPKGRDDVGTEER